MVVDEMKGRVMMMLAAGSTFGCYWMDGAVRYEYPLCFHVSGTGTGRGSLSLSLSICLGIEYAVNRLLLLLLPLHS